MPTDKKPKPRITKTTSPVRDPGLKYASVGKYTTTDERGNVVDDTAFRGRVAAIGIGKTAGILDSGIGGANIADSGNINYYNYEFPVDSLELPQSRPEELRYYRIAYDRDPIVARAIDLHTEIPMSKINLEKPKCSSQEFADFVFDFYQGLVNRTRLFEIFLHATREYWAIGEAFLYVEDDPDIELCKEAEKELGMGRKVRDAGRGPVSESMNPPLNLDYIGLPSRTSSLKLSKLLKISAEKVVKDLDKLLLKTQLGIIETNEKLAALKTARVITRMGPEDTHKKADPPADTPAPDTTPAPGGDAPAPDGGDAITGDEPIGGDSPEGVDDFGGDSPDLSGPLPSGTSGGGNPLAGTPLGDQVDEAMQQDVADPEIVQMKKYLKLLKQQQELLEELKTLKENRAKDLEIFAHMINKDYLGFDKIQLLPPESVEIQVDPMEGPQVFFKPSERQKQTYLESEDLDAEVRENLEQNGTLPLNTDPLKGSYLIHFARKKAPFEPHGRSILQRCMRTILYRDKLRQVQTTLASRNMTPKTLITAPNVPQSELVALRAHVDEAKSDPDYTVVVNYECTWNEIGSEGRLLALDGEWAHTNQDLAAGLGFTPEILTGEGMYSNSRIQLEILNTTYLQYRDIISDIIENLIFKPIAMKKGFYEIDRYGRPRWIYPKISFARMALRDSADIYEMMYNLYSKGSLPVEIILEFLSIDPEACRKKLEEDLFTVNDSKFNDFLVNLYSNIAGNARLIDGTDVIDKLSKNIGLKTKDLEDEEGLEGTGEGIH